MCNRETYTHHLFRHNLLRTCILIVYMNSEIHKRPNTEAIHNIYGYWDWANSFNAVVVGFQPFHHPFFLLPKKYSQKTVFCMNNHTIRPILSNECNEQPLKQNITPKAHDMVCSVIIRNGQKKSSQCLPNLYWFQNINRPLVFSCIRQKKNLQQRNQCGT